MICATHFNGKYPNALCWRWCTQMRYALSYLRITYVVLLLLFLGVFDCLFSLKRKICSGLNTSIILGHCLFGVNFNVVNI